MSLEQVRAYHERTKHHPRHYAASLGYMDWATQPDPFRRYDGAPITELEHPEDSDEPSYDALWAAPPPAAALSKQSLSQLLYYSLALSAWKAAGSQRWALRVNPSSGNLHPTEGYVICGPVPGLTERASISHYAPDRHALELRRELADEEWERLAAGLPPDSLLLGLASIHWREAWKYGERAFRYCQHDVGHALGAIAVAARLQGWQVRVLTRPTDDDVARLLGVVAQAGSEAEHPDCLLLLAPEGARYDPAWRPDRQLLEDLAGEGWQGQPNQLSPEHHRWEAIDTVAAACRELGDDPFAEVPASDRPTARDESRVSARRLIRRRRSAVAMDGETPIERSRFYRLLGRLRSGSFATRTLPWRCRVHLALFVHRVAGLEPGLYWMTRDEESRSQLRAEFSRDFAWRPAPDQPEELGLVLLEAGDLRETATLVSCGQEIAGEGAFSVGILAEFDQTLDRYGPAFYRRLFWETGLVGQLLYLEAEAAGLRGTGIGCFFDDLVHSLLGIEGTRLQSLYHFTVGGAIDDPRLQSLPAYTPRP